MSRIFFNEQKGQWQVKPKKRGEFTTVKWQQELAAFNACLKLNGGKYDRY